jgi:hypothetical protein
MHTIFLFENLKRTDHEEDAVLDGMIILEWILRKFSGKLWTEFMWLRIGTNGVVL